MRHITPGLKHSHHWWAQRSRYRHDAADGVVNPDFTRRDASQGWHLPKSSHVQKLRATAQVALARFLGRRPGFPSSSPQTGWTQHSHAACTHTSTPFSTARRSRRQTSGPSSIRLQSRTRGSPSPSPRTLKSTRCRLAATRAGDVSSSGAGAASHNGEGAVEVMAGTDATPRPLELMLSHVHSLAQALQK